MTTRPGKDRLAAPLLCALFTLLCASGCGSVYLSDDIALDLRLSALLIPSDSLHAPYVPGTKVRFFVHSTKDRERMDGWTLESLDPTVLQVVRQSVQDHRLSAECLTLAEGQATLLVRDSGGQEIHRSTVDIEQPDRADLYAHGPLIIGRTEAPRTEAQVLAGGAATFLVEYSRAGHRVYGNGVLSAEGGADVLAEPRTTFLLINREWLTVTAVNGRVGTTPITLKANGRPVAVLSVRAAQEADIARIDVLGEDEARGQRGDPMALIVQAYDKADAVIYGVTYNFMLAGAMQNGTGDLFRYTFDPDKPTLLTAVHGALRSSAMLHTGMGYVSSTNVIGCQAAPGRPAPAVPALFGLGVALCLLSRRRWRRPRAAGLSRLAPGGTLLPWTAASSLSPVRSSPR